MYFNHENVNNQKQGQKLAINNPTLMPILFETTQCKFDIYLEIYIIFIIPYCYIDM